MNLLDILLVVILGASVVTGYIAGFARVGIGFIATITGLLFGFWFYGIPAEWFHRHFKSVALSNLMGFFLVFCGCMILGSLIGKLLSKLFKWTGLSWLDRILGGAFGFVRGTLVAVAFVAVLLAFTPRPLPAWMVDSSMLPYAINASDVCADLAPSAIKDAFRESMHDMKIIWDEQLKKKKRKSDLKAVDS